MADPTPAELLADFKAELAKLRAAPPARAFNPLAFLDGNKTYILVGVASIVTAAQAVGYLTPDQARPLLELCGAGAVATMRHAIGKLQPSGSSTPPV